MVVSSKRFGICNSSNFQIYLCHALSSWGDRIWNFAVGLYLIIIYPDSLLVTAIYGLSMSISVLIFGATVGKWIDNTKRLHVAQVTRLGQNLAIAASAAVLVIILEYGDQVEADFGIIWKYSLILLLIIFALIGNMFSEASTISLEKDWIVVLCDGDESNLSRINAMMRSINLTTYTLAPVAVGALTNYSSQITGALFIGSWNLCSGVVEYLLLTNLYKIHPELSRKLLPEQNADSTGWLLHANESLSGWKLYFGHPVRNAGLGLAFLYMTVLGFDSVTTGFGYSQGISESILGLMASIGAVFGILGSISFHFIRRKFGKVYSGNIGFGLETICLILCLASIFSPGSPFIYGDIFGGGKLSSDTTKLESLTFIQLWNSNISIFLHMGGIILSRYGLWIADLSVVQIFQEEISENQRGVINGVQASLNRLMDLIKFLIVVIFPFPSTFGYLIFISWLFVFSGWMFFVSFSIQQRNRSDEVTPFLKSVKSYESMEQH